MRPVLLAAVLVVLAGCTAMPPNLPDLGPIAPPPQATGTLRLHVVDVGQGDGAVLQLPDGSVVVYDCGPPATATSNPVTRFLREGLGLAPGAAIHALVVSHGHLDHLGGCDEVLADYVVAHVVDTWYEGADATQAYRRFHDQARAEGAQLHTLREVPGAVRAALGGEVPVPPAARSAGARLAVTWPGSLDGAAWDAIGERSIVLRVTFGRVAACLQGDIERVEATLAQRGGDAACDVYLVGHHGSNDSSSAAWLARMDPEVAVVSFGANEYGHPHPAALCRVQQAGAKVYAPHRLGTVTVSTDGSAVQVAPDRAETKDYCATGASYWT